MEHGFYAQITPDNRLNVFLDGVKIFSHMFVIGKCNKTSIELLSDGKTHQVEVCNINHLLSFTDYSLARKSPLSVWHYSLVALTHNINENMARILLDSVVNKTACSLSFKGGTFTPPVVLKRDPNGRLRYERKLPDSAYTNTYYPGDNMLVNLDDLLGFI
jgi:hypothetical protein